MNNSSSNEWGCHHFNVTREELESSDFYLIRSDNLNNLAGWIIDKANPQNSTIYQFTSNPTLINDKIWELMGNGNKTVLWLHIMAEKSPNNNYSSYIVSVPKGTPQDMVNLNYLNTRPWFFVLRVWR